MGKEISFVKLKSYLEKEIPNSIVLFGKDDYLKKTSVDLAKRAIVLSMPEMNFCKIEEFDVDQILKEANTMPFLDEKRIVVVSKVENAQKNDLTQLAQYLTNPNESTILILVSGEDQPKLDADLFVNCNTLDNQTLISWIKVNAKKQNVKIDDAACMCLVDRTSGQMMRVKSELDKLCAYVGPNAEISTKHVEDNVSPENEYQVFAFTELVSKNQKQKALQMMEQMLVYEKNIFGIWSALYSHFRRMFYAKISKQSPKEIADLLGVKEYAIIKARAQAENFRAKELKNILDIIAEVEENVKSGKLSQDIAIKTGLVNILNTRG